MRRTDLGRLNECMPTFHLKHALCLILVVGVTLMWGAWYQTDELTANKLLAAHRIHHRIRSDGRVYKSRETALGSPAENRDCEIWDTIVPRFHRIARPPLHRSCLLLALVGSQCCLPRGRLPRNSRCSLRYIALWRCVHVLYVVQVLDT